MNESESKYVAPKAKVVELSAQAIICQSMEEVDLGDGGFSEQ